MTNRAAPNHCPFCGDTNLWPHEGEQDGHGGGWECRSCLRAFMVTMIGRLSRPSLGGDQ
ncbi:hypothetical protein [Marmoricola sp. RAF53]|uniref:hypothetical protein n=1 Tax=Marmoricola sp. RAF53 TaxID=3233059 RepID=UPI003F948724